jgi:SAM-dependent methyltransferase
MLKDKIEIPPVKMLEDHHQTVEDFKTLGRMLGHYAVGWSYYLEWAWVFSQIDPDSLNRKVVIDAGAGHGLTQWYLAEHGSMVYSIDRLSRACLPLYFRKRYSVAGVRTQDLLTVSQFINPFNRLVGTRERVCNILRSLKGTLLQFPANKAPGKVHIYNQDLARLVDIPDNSVDLVVSISSLEHNTPDNLSIVLKELNRVLKPGGVLIATLAAALEKDWYHIPSSSWCYTEKTLKRLFKFAPDVPSNYGDFYELLKSVRANKELKEGLSFQYFLGGKNGMPWGKWNPVYLPVGVVKVKK